MASGIGVCHFANYLAYFFRRYLAYESRGRGHCVNLSPYTNVMQYSFATLKPKQIERRVCGCKTDPLRNLARGLACRQLSLPQSRCWVLLNKLFLKSQVYRCTINQPACEEWQAGSEKSQPRPSRCELLALDRPFSRALKRFGISVQMPSVLSTGSRAAAADRGRRQTLICS
jgi:hypothetical protein